MLRNFLSHPLPETFNRIEVRAVAWQLYELDAQLLYLRANQLAAVPGRSVPDNDELAFCIITPLRQSLQKLNGMFTVTFTFVPDEGSAIRKVIGAVPVDPCRKRWADTLAPNRLAYGCPGVAQIQVLVKMRLIDIDDADLTLAHTLE